MNKESKAHKNQAKKQGQAANNSYNAEFASETDVQEVKQQNAQSEAKENK
ncbi:gamma-type small acid-soluble spore protein [Shouchella lonarensis]|uniref:Small, acid-soluble spore protein gamma-type n=1 Tax=Shouchella lonarensis TaxID=1464122 RepID=A0A1G6GQG0_9BACI|nr:gamma-type small acid-soluble spore protein [Shouchella lonarensis]SDB83975.1 small acid-soluble spore protein E (minor gamma-type SASP) [Shouchella lonarensis]